MKLRGFGGIRSAAIPIKGTAALLAISLLFSSTVPPFAEASLWAERQKALAQHRRQSTAKSPEKHFNLLPAPGARPETRISGVSPLPSEFGEIVDSRSGAGIQNSTAPLIIHIQDAHGYIESQKNLAKILRHLAKSAPLLVAVEGAWKKVDLEWLHLFPESAIVREFADGALERGEITGEEHVSIVDGEQAAEIVGVEDESIYQANVTARNAVQTDSDKIIRGGTSAREANIAALVGHLGSLKKSIYPARLIELDLARNGLDTGGINIDGLVLLLKRSAPSVFWEKHATDALNQLAGAADAESRLQPEAISEERDALIKRLGESLDPQSLQRLAQFTLEYRFARLSGLEYYRALALLAQQHSIKLRHIPAYVDYLQSVEGLNGEAAFDQLNAFADLLEEHFARGNEEAERLLLLDRWARLQKKLWSLELNPREWERCKELARSMEWERFQGEYERIARRAANAGGLDWSLLRNVVGNRTDDVSEYFELAQRRDKVLAQGALKLMRERGASRVVLVAGGFHTAGILDELSRQGASVVVIRPALGNKEVVSRDDGFDQAISSVFALRAASAGMSPQSFVPRFSAILLAIARLNISNPRKLAEALREFAGRLQAHYGTPRAGRLIREFGKISFFAPRLKAGGTKFVLGAVQGARGSVPFAMSNQGGRSDVLYDNQIDHLMNMRLSPDNDWNVKGPETEELREIAPNLLKGAEVWPLSLQTQMNGQVIVRKPVVAGNLLGTEGADNVSTRPAPEAAASGIAARWSAQAGRVNDWTIQRLQQAAAQIRGRWIPALTRFAMRLLPRVQTQGRAGSTIRRIAISTVLAAGLFFGFTGLSADNASAAEIVTDENGVVQHIVIQSGDSVHSALSQAIAMMPENADASQEEINRQVWALAGELGMQNRNLIYAGDIIPVQERGITITIPPAENPAAAQTVDVQPGTNQIVPDEEIQRSLAETPPEPVAAAADVEAETGKATPTPAPAEYPQPDPAVEQPFAPAEISDPDSQRPVEPDVTDSKSPLWQRLYSSPLGAALMGASALGLLLVSLFAWKRWRANRVSASSAAEQINFRDAAAEQLRYLAARGSTLHNGRAPRVAAILRTLIGYMENDEFAYHMAKNAPLLLNMDAARFEKVEARVLALGSGKSAYTNHYKALRSTARMISGKQEFNQAVTWTYLTYLLYYTNVKALVHEAYADYEQSLRQDFEAAAPGLESYWSLTDPDSLRALINDMAAAGDAIGDRATRRAMTAFERNAETQTDHELSELLSKPKLFRIYADELALALRQSLQEVRSALETSASSRANTDRETTVDRQRRALDRFIEQKADLERQQIEGRLSSRNAIKLANVSREIGQLQAALNRKPERVSATAAEISSIAAWMERIDAEGSGIRTLKGEGIEMRLLRRNLDDFRLGIDFGDCTSLETDRGQQTSFDNYSWTVAAWLMDPAYQVAVVERNGTPAYKAHIGLKAVDGRLTPVVLDQPFMDTLIKMAERRNDAELAKFLTSAEGRQKLFDPVHDWLSDVARRMGRENFLVTVIIPRGFVSMSGSRWIAAIKSVLGEKLERWVSDRVKRARGRTALSPYQTASAENLAERASGEETVVRAHEGDGISAGFSSTLGLRSLDKDQARLALAYPAFESFVTDFAYRSNRLQIISLRIRDAVERNQRSALRGAVRDLLKTAEGSAMIERIAADAGVEPARARAMSESFIRQMASPIRLLPGRRYSAPEPSPAKAPEGNAIRQFLWTDFLLGLSVRFVFFQPFILFIDRFSAKEVGLFFILGEIFSFFFEVPTGVIADRLGRKTSFYLGTAFKGVTAALLAGIALSFGQLGDGQLAAALIAATFFSSLSLSFISGANRAFLYDALRARSPADDDKVSADYEKYRGIAWFGQRVARFGMAGAAAAAVYALGFHVMFLLDFAIVAASIVLLHSMPLADFAFKKEVREAGAEKRPAFSPFQAASAAATTLRGSTSELMDRLSKPRVFFALGVFGVIAALESVMALLLVTRGMEPAAIGVLLSALEIVKAVFALAAFRIKKRFPSQLVAFSFVTAFAGFALLLVGGGGWIVIGTGIALIAAVDGLLYIVTDSLLNREISSSHRATSLSMITAIQTGMRVLFTLIYAVSLDQGSGSQGLWAIFGILSGSLGLFGALFIFKSFRSKLTAFGGAARRIQNAIRFAMQSTWTLISYPAHKIFNEKLRLHASFFLYSTVTVARHPEVLGRLALAIWTRLAENPAIVRLRFRQNQKLLLGVLIDPSDIVSENASGRMNRLAGELAELPSHWRITLNLIVHPPQDLDFERLLEKKAALTFPGIDVNIVYQEFSPTENPEKVLLSLRRQGVRNGDTIIGLFDPRSPLPMGSLLSSLKTLARSPTERIVNEVPGQTYFWARHSPGSAGGLPGFESLTTAAVPAEDALPSNQTVAVISPHSDDEFLGLWKTMQALLRRGNRIVIVGMVDGEFSAFPRVVSGIPSNREKAFEQLGKVRENEARSAAAALARRVSESASEQITYVALGLDLEDGPGSNVALYRNGTLRHNVYWPASITAEHVEKVRQVLADNKVDALFLPDPFDGHATHIASWDVAVEAAGRLADERGAALPGYAYQTISHLPGGDINAVRSLLLDEAETLEKRTLFESLYPSQRMTGVIQRVPSRVASTRIIAQARAKAEGLDRPERFFSFESWTPFSIPAGDWARRPWSLHSVQSTGETARLRFSLSEPLFEAADSRTRVLHVLSNFDVGGGMINTAALAAQVDRSRYQVAFIAGHSAEPWMSKAAELQLKGVRFRGLTNRTANNPSLIALVSNFIQIYRIIKKERPEIVHFHSGFVLPIAAKLAGGSRTKVIKTHHTGVEYNFIRFGRMRGWVLTTLEMITDWMIDKTIFLSRTVAQNYGRYGFPLRKAAVIPSAIELQHFLNHSASKNSAREKLGLNAGGPVIGAVTRIEHVKRLDLLVDAMAAISKKYPSAQLVIAGGDQMTGLKSELIERARRLGIEGNVIFLGHVNDVATVYAALDLFILPSSSETFGLAVMEAMAMGKPVIVSAAELRHLTERGEGLHIPEPDAEKLADAALTLLAEPQRLEAMGVRARKRAQAFHARMDIRLMHDQLYKDLLSDAKNTRAKRWAGRLASVLIFPKLIGSARAAYSARSEQWAAGFWKALNSRVLFVDVKLWLIIGFGFLLRVWNINYNSAFVDEGLYMTIGIDGWLNGNFWNDYIAGNPYFYPTIAFGSYLLGTALGMEPLLVLRFVNAVFGAVTIGIVYALIKSLRFSEDRAANKAIAMLGALVFSMIPAAVTVGRLGTYDAPSNMFFALGLLLIVRAFRKPDDKRSAQATPSIKKILRPFGSPTAFTFYGASAVVISMGFKLLSFVYYPGFLALIVFLKLSRDSKAGTASAFGIPQLAKDLLHPRRVAGAATQAILLAVPLSIFAATNYKIIVSSIVGFSEAPDFFQPISRFELFFYSINHLGLAAFGLMAIGIYLLWKKARHDIRMIILGLGTLITPYVAFRMFSINYTSMHKDMMLVGIILSAFAGYALYAIAGFKEGARFKLDRQWPKRAVLTLAVFSALLFGIQQSVYREAGRMWTNDRQVYAAIEQRINPEDKVLTFNQGTAGYYLRERIAPQRIESIFTMQDGTSYSNDREKALESVRAGIYEYIVLDRAQGATVDADIFNAASEGYEVIHRGQSSTIYSEGDVIVLERKGHVARHDSAFRDGFNRKLAPYLDLTHRMTDHLKAALVVMLAALASLWTVKRLRGKAPVEDFADELGDPEPMHAQKFLGEFLPELAQAVSAERIYQNVRDGIEQLRRHPNAENDYPQFIFRPNFDLPQESQKVVPFVIRLADADLNPHEGRFENEWESLKDWLGKVDAPIIVAVDSIEKQSDYINRIAAFYLGERVAVLEIESGRMEFRSNTMPAETAVQKLFQNTAKSTRFWPQYASIAFLGLFSANLVATGFFALRLGTMLSFLDPLARWSLLAAGAAALLTGSILFARFAARAVLALTHREALPARTPWTLRKAAILLAAATVMSVSVLFNTSAVTESKHPVFGFYQPPLVTSAEIDAPLNATEAVFTRSVRIPVDGESLAGESLVFDAWGDRVAGADKFSAQLTLSNGETYSASFTSIDSQPREIRMPMNSFRNIAGTRLDELDLERNPVRSIVFSGADQNYAREISIRNLRSEESQRSNGFLRYLAVQQIDRMLIAFAFASAIFTWWFARMLSSRVWRPWSWKNAQRAQDGNLEPPSAGQSGESLEGETLVFKETMNWRDKIGFALVGIPVTAFFLNFALYWITEVTVTNDPGSHTLNILLFSLLSFCIWAKALSETFVMLNLPRMKDPVIPEPKPGMKIANFTGFVPSSEPLDVLAEHVRSAALGHYPHDVWVGDEGDIDEARRMMAAFNTIQMHQMLRALAAGGGTPVPVARVIAHEKALTELARGFEKATGDILFPYIFEQPRFFQGLNLSSEEADDLAQNLDRAIERDLAEGIGSYEVKLTEKPARLTMGAGFHELMFASSHSSAVQSALGEIRRAFHFSRKGVAEWNQPAGLYRARTKAGNQNAFNAFLREIGNPYEFIAQCDVDYVWYPNFLTDTMGSFRDATVGAVVAPQRYGKHGFMRSWIEGAADEQAHIFHGVLQRSFSIFIGTVHIVRISTMDDAIGGYVPKIVEDNASGQRLYEKGFKTVYVAKPLASGEGPTNFAQFFTQQQRWAVGVMEVLFKQTTKKFPYLSLQQTLWYLFIQSFYMLVGLTTLVSVGLTVFSLFTDIHSSQLSSGPYFTAFGLEFVGFWVVWFWAQRFYYDPSQKGLGLKGMLMTLASIPVYMSSLAFHFKALFVKPVLDEKPDDLGYVVTPKGEQDDRKIDLPLFGSLMRGSLVMVTVAASSLAWSFWTGNGSNTLRFWMMVVGVLNGTVIVSFLGTYIRTADVIAFAESMRSRANSAIASTGDIFAYGLRKAYGVARPAYMHISVALVGIVMIACSAALGSQGMARPGDSMVLSPPQPSRGPQASPLTTPNLIETGHNPATATPTPRANQENLPSESVIRQPPVIPELPPELPLGSFVPLPPRKVESSLFDPDSRAITIGAFDDTDAMAGLTKIDHKFYGWDGRNVEWIRSEIEKAAAQDKIFMMTWKPVPEGEFNYKDTRVVIPRPAGWSELNQWDYEGYYYSEVYAGILRGEYDPYLRDMARVIADSNQKVIIRWSHEMDLLLRTPQQAEDFKAAWRYMHAIFAEEGADVSWMWSPAGGVNAQYELATYWPGDEFVDTIGFTAFSYHGWEEWNAERSRTHAYRSFSELIGPRYQTLAATGKPILLAEFNISLHAALDNPGTTINERVEREKEWLADALQKMPTEFPGIRGVIFFNTNHMDVTGTRVVIDWHLTDGKLEVVSGGVQNNPSFEVLPPKEPNIKLGDLAAIGVGTMALGVISATGYFSMGFAPALWALLASSLYGMGTLAKGLGLISSRSNRITVEQEIASRNPIVHAHGLLHQWLEQPALRRFGLGRHELLIVHLFDLPLAPILLAAHAFRSVRPSLSRRMQDSAGLAASTLRSIATIAKELVNDVREIHAQPFRAGSRPIHFSPAPVFFRMERAHQWIWSRSGFLLKPFWLFAAPRLSANASALPRSTVQGALLEDMEEGVSAASGFENTRGRVHFSSGWTIWVAAAWTSGFAAYAHTNDLRFSIGSALLGALIGSGIWQIFARTRIREQLSALAFARRHGVAGELALGPGYWVRRLVSLAEMRTRGDQPALPNMQPKTVDALVDVPQVISSLYSQTAEAWNPKNPPQVYILDTRGYVTVSRDRVHTSPAFEQILANTLTQIRKSREHGKAAELSLIGEDAASLKIIARDLGVRSEIDERLSIPAPSNDPTVPADSVIRRIREARPRLGQASIQVVSSLIYESYWKEAKTAGIGLVIIEKILDFGAQVVLQIPRSAWNEQFALPEGYSGDWTEKDGTIELRLQPIQEMKSSLNDDMWSERLIATQA